MFDLTTGGPRLRYVCNHLKHPTSGEPPVIVLKPAGFDLYSGWRRPEAAREQALRRRQHALYAAAGITAQEAAQAYLQMQSHSELAAERNEGLEALYARLEAGEAVQDEIDALQAEGEASAVAWQAALDVIAKIERAAVDLEPHADTIDNTRHTFELVLACVDRVEGVSAGGQPIVWQDAALAQLGLTREVVLLKLLGAEGGAQRLYDMAALVTQGLTDQEKKA